MERNWEMYCEQPSSKMNQIILDSSKPEEEMKADDMFWWWVLGVVRGWFWSDGEEWPYQGPDNLKSSSSENFFKSDLARMTFPKIFFPVECIKLPVSFILRPKK